MTDAFSVSHESLAVVVTLELKLIKMKMQHLMSQAQVKRIQALDINGRNSNSQEMPASTLHEMPKAVFITRNVEGNLVTVGQFPSSKWSGHPQSLVGKPHQVTSYMDAARHLTNPWKSEILYRSRGSIVNYP